MASNFKGFLSNQIPSTYIFCCNFPLSNLYVEERNNSLRQSKTINLRHCINNIAFKSNFGGLTFLWVLPAVEGPPLPLTELSI